MKLQFYIDSDNDAERCEAARRLGKPIAIDGEDTLTGRIKSYAGVVLSVESLPDGAPGDRWRIAIDTTTAR